ncbi:unnamed protein product [Prorocentrum cordatum]|uniref:Selenoprotein O n=1 Tax=Prorocentrum cordatum TaxID=2364126 RepID=A0ABN9TB48_9DINO|nr:unnamed protein product [Polarella glacialis]
MRWPSASRRHPAVWRCGAARRGRAPAPLSAAAPSDAEASSQRAQWWPEEAAEGAVRPARLDLSVAPRLAQSRDQALRRSTAVPRRAPAAPPPPPLRRLAAAPWWIRAAPLGELVGPAQRHLTAAPFLAEVSSGSSPEDRAVYHLGLGPDDVGWPR